MPQRAATTPAARPLYPAAAGSAAAPVARRCGPPKASAASPAPPGEWEAPPPAGCGAGRPELTGPPWPGGVRSVKIEYPSPGPSLLATGVGCSRYAMPPLSTPSATQIVQEVLPQRRRVTRAPAGCAESYIQGTVSSSIQNNRISLSQ